MNKILILTTRGCEACEIALRNIEIAVSQVSKKIEIDNKNWTEVSKEFISKYGITDFPTVLYFVNNKLVNKSVGTYPSAIYLRWIDMYFKK